MRPFERLRHATGVAPRGAVLPAPSPGAAPRWRLETGGLARLIAFAAAAWLPAMGATWMLAHGALGPGSAIGLALFGGLAASGLVLRSRVRRVEPALRAAARDATTWQARANPAGQYANRWASYEDLSERLARQDWSGRAVVEFGHTNAVLRAFTPGASHTVLAYPEHDVQDLRAVSSEAFDLAILDHTLEHVPDPERALREVHRVLRPGGAVIVTTPFLVPVHATREYGDYVRWTPQGMEAMLRRCGFAPEVRMWGNREAARVLLDEMYLTAEHARTRGLRIGVEDCDADHPVTVWAYAPAQK